MEASPKTPPESGRQPPVAPLSTGGLIVIAVVAIATAVGVYALFQTDPWGENSSTTADRFSLDLDAQMHIPAELLSHIETGQIDVSSEGAHAVAVGPDGHIYVAVKNAIEILHPDGRSLTTVPTESTPSCLAVAGEDHVHPGYLYAGVERRVIVIDAKGKVAANWESLNEKAIITAIAVTPQTVLVADAGNRYVVRFSAAGERLGEIGAEQPDRDMPGFIIPSPYFDLVAGPDQSIAVVNPGMRRVETYSSDGQLQSVWGGAGSQLRDFFGCCNPSHIARLADGRIVTSEKGIPRVKIYSAVGDFESVVAGPRQLEVSQAALGDARGDQVEKVFDVAVDPADRILVLDPGKQCIRVFEALRSEPTKDKERRGRQPKTSSTSVCPLPLVAEFLSRKQTFTHL